MAPYSKADLARFCRIKAGALRSRAFRTTDPVAAAHLVACMHKMQRMADELERDD